MDKLLPCIKSAADIAGMRLAGRLAADVLDFIAPYVRAGTSTDRLDRLCHERIASVPGAGSALLRYAPPGQAPYPKSIFTSINYEACHGIPGGRALEEGDIVGITVAVSRNGYHASAGRMYFAGGPSPVGRRICEVAQECLRIGIAAARPGARIGDVGTAIQMHAERRGCSVVREFGGHGIGRSLHEMPNVPHWAKPGMLDVLQPGMTLAIGPILNSGRRDVRKLPDGWTVVTKDYGLSAQWEHTVLVTQDGCEVLTMLGQ